MKPVYVLGIGPFTVRPDGADTMHLFTQKKAHSPLTYTSLPALRGARCFAPALFHNVLIQLWETSSAADRFVLY